MLSGYFKANWQAAPLWNAVAMWGFFFYGVWGRGWIGISPIRSCEWGSAHICVRLMLIQSLFIKWIWMDGEKTKKANLLPPIPFHLWFSAHDQSLARPNVSCADRDGKEVDWRREDGALGYCGGSCLHTAPLTSHDINSRSAHTPTRLVSHWADKGRREALPLWLQFTLLSLLSPPCDVWVLGLPAIRCFSPLLF